MKEKSELLDKLMDIFFITKEGEIMWSLIEDTPLHKEDPDLAKELLAIYGPSTDQWIVKQNERYWRRKYHD